MRASMLRGKFSRPGDDEKMGQMETRGEMGGGMKRQANSEKGRKMLPC